MSRELLTLKTAKVELETQLREKDAAIEKLEGDRRWLSEREKEEREARVAEGEELEKGKVCTSSISGWLKTNFL